jgi:hypothetical protein
MTAFVLEPQPFRRGPSGEVAAVVGIASAAAVLALFAAGVAFFGLAIAPVAEALGVHVRAADPAFAGQVAGLWPVFVVLTIASFVAAALVAAKAFEFLSPRD